MVRRTLLLRVEIHPLFGFIRSLNGLGVLDSLMVIIASLAALPKIAGISLRGDLSTNLTI